MASIAFAGDDTTRGVCEVSGRYSRAGVSAATVAASSRGRRIEKMAPGAARVLEAQRAAVLAQDVVRNRETESGAALGASAGLIDSIEALEDLRGVLGRHAGTVVRDAEHHRFPIELGSQRDRAAGRRDAGGVVDEHQECLVQTIAVAADPEVGGALDEDARLRREASSFLGGGT